MKMQTGIRYIVTKASDDGTFNTGDQVGIDSDGDVSNYTMGGWIEVAEVEDATKGLEIVVDREWVERKLQSLREQVAKLEAAIQ